MPDPEAVNGHRSKVGSQDEVQVSRLHEMAAGNWGSYIELSTTTLARPRYKTQLMDLSFSSESRSQSPKTQDNPSPRLLQDEAIRALPPGSS